MGVWESLKWPKVSLCDCSVFSSSENKIWLVILTVFLCTIGKNNISVVVTYLDKEKSFSIPRHVLESERGMVKIRACIEDEFGDDDDEFENKFDDEIIRIRRNSDSDCSVGNDDIIEKLEDMDDTNEIKFKLKI